MPTYLCHGFRWQRRSVRVYVILQNLDDASPEWIIPARSSRCILQSFYEVFDFLPYCSPKRGRYTPTQDVDNDYGTKDRSRSRGRRRSQSQSTHQSRSHSHPTQPQPLPPVPGIADDSSSSSTTCPSSEDDFTAQSWSAIKLLEEYDPRDLTSVSRPYAYVADYAVRIDLSCSIVDEIARYEQQQLQSAYPSISIPSKDSPAKGAGWFEQLRDQLQSGEEIRWYVVVNGDEVRDWPDELSEAESISKPEEGDPYQPYQQQQQQYQYPHQYQPPPGRPLPTKEQRQHHAQYIHQQRIFEGADREKEQEQVKPLALEASDRLQSEDPRQSLEWMKQQELQRERERKQQQEQQQLQQRLAWKKEQELKREREREWQREKEREQERERQRERERQLEIKKERERSRQREERVQRQREEKPRLNGADTADTKPPMVPEKDHYYFPRPPTAKTTRAPLPLRPKMSFDANANPQPPPLRPKMSFDAGAIGRPKTPSAKGGGLRRLFGRAKAEVG